MADLLDPSVTEALRAWRIQHSAGVGVADALNTCAPVCRIPADRECFEAAAVLASRGADITALLEALRPLLSDADRAALAAGWNGGRIEAIMDAVIAQRELWQLARTKIRGRLMMPVAVLVLASFVGPLPALIQNGSVPQYIISALAPLAVAYLFWRGCNNLLSQNRGSTSAAGAPAPPTRLDDLKLNLPLLRDVERHRNLAEFSGYLSNLLAAGVPITSALETCASTASNGHYRLAIAQSARTIRGGSTFAPSLQPQRLFPPEYISALSVGEKSGRLDDVLARISASHRDSYIRAVDAFAEWLPRLIYAIVALFIIAYIAQMLCGIVGLYGTALS